MDNRVASCLLALGIASLSIVGYVLAKDKEAPPWMENVVSGDRKVYLIPKGAKKEFIGSQVIVEATEEYVARRLYEFERAMNDQFEKIEADNNQQAAEIEQLKKEISDLKELNEAGFAEDNLDIEE